MTCVTPPRRSGCEYRSLPKLAQKWGGWRDLSTFLNVSRGVLAGEEEDAIEAATAYLDRFELPEAR